jgi:multiple sugar transport system permease protein
MAQAALPKRKPVSRMKRNEAIAGLAFVLPWIISLLVFTAYPVIASFYYSFTQYSIIQAPKWIGLENYVTMFTADPAFSVSVYNSAYYAFLAVPLGLLSSLGLALLLNMRVRFIGGYRTLFYMASLTPPVAATIIFVIMFQPRGGLINGILGFFGIQGPAWFTDPDWAKAGLIILSLWGVGASSLIFLAGLKDIPYELLEAASIDGANAWTRLWRITIPLLTPIILYNLVTGIIASFQVFTAALVIGGTTGKPQESLLMYFVHLYRNAFRYFNMGYASAMAVVLFIFVMIITILIFKSTNRWVFYESEQRD